MRFDEPRDLRPKARHEGMPVLEAEIVKLELDDLRAVIGHQCAVVEISVDRDDDQVARQGIVSDGVVWPRLIDVLRKHKIGRCPKVELSRQVHVDQKTRHQLAASTA